jgi:hypothetical protein
LDLVRGGTKEEIRKKAMAVSAHGYEVAAFIFDPFNDLVGGFAVSKFGVRWDVLGLQFGLDFVEIGSVFDDFAADGIGTVGAGGPSVGDVEQNQTAVGEFGQSFDVFDDGPVAWGAIESD